MKKVYKVGFTDAEISITVQVGTPAPASTKVYQCRSGQPKKQLLESRLGSGDIDQKVIGKAADLAGSYVVVHTLLDIGILDRQRWHQTLDTLVIRYTFSGGLQGYEHFDYDVDNRFTYEEGRIVVVITPLKVIQE